MYTTVTFGNHVDIFFQLFFLSKQSLVVHCYVHIFELLWEPLPIGIVKLFYRVYHLPNHIIKVHWVR